MPDSDVEDIGGISVSIGASHSRLVSDLAEAERLVQASIARMSQSAVVTIRAQAQQAQQATAVARQQAAPMAFGPGVATRVQAAQGQTNLQRMVAAELAKTGERLDENGEIVAATTAKVRAQRQAFIEVQQEAAKPTELNIDTAALQNDLQTILSTLREIVATASKVPALPATGAATGAAATGRSRVRVADPELERLTAEAAAAANTAPTSATFAPEMTQAQRAQFLRERTERAATAPGPRTESRYQFEPGARRGTPPPRTGASRDPFVGELGEFGAEVSIQELRRVLRGQGVREVISAQIARSEEASIAQREANVLTQGRTARTSASGLSGFLFGGRRSAEEAQVRFGITERDLQSAIRYRGVFDQIIRDREVEGALGDESAQAQAEAIRNTRLYKDAQSGVVAAEGRRAAALKDVQRFTEGLVPAARNLAAITLGGAAFGIGLQAAGAAIEVISKSAQPAVDRLTGFATVGSRVVNVLSDETKAANSNAQAVVAVAAAHAGLSARAAQVVQPLVTEQTQIEANNKSIAAAVDLFQTYQRLRTSGVSGINAPTGGFLGTGLLGTQSTSQELGRLFEGLPTPQATLPRAFNGFAGQPLGGGANPQFEAEVAVVADSLAFVNEQLVKGGETLRKFEANLDPEALRASTEAFRASGAASLEFLNSLDANKIGVRGITPDDARRILQSFNAGFSAPDPNLLLQQFNRQIPSIIAQVQRQTAFATGTQLPAQFALQGLAGPNVAPGTGIAEQDRQRVAGTLQEANDLQAQLNQRYDTGRRIIADTYRPSIVQNFGQAAAESFDQSLLAVVSTGRQIASIQEGISNDQAAYQAAQYNFQLQIAKRTLGDIAGLTGRNYGVEQTRLGVLQRQNLELSRQAQTLQFDLAQRQINFQTAVAGFNTPGVTPEERQANVKAAQIEAEYAQKQLDIQRKMFGNQVQIVDIGNLRQGADLVRQITLLQQGRQVQIDTAAAEQKLNRLQQLQAQNVAQVSTYLSAVDGLVSTAIGQIAQLEAAAGKAMSNIAVSVLTQFGIFITGLSGVLAGGTSGATGGGFGNRTGSGQQEFASGVVANTLAPTRIGENGVMGEAAGETLIVLSRPRSASNGGGGSTLVVNFNGPVHANDRNDLDYIVRSVMEAVGREGAIRGFRTVG